MNISERKDFIEGQVSILRTLLRRLHRFPALNVFGVIKWIKDELRDFEDSKESIRVADYKLDNLLLRIRQREEK